METNKLQNVWRSVGSEINPKTMDELNQSLIVKTNKVFNRFLFIIILDVFICTGLIVFLIITALNRQGDLIYQVNNSILCLITLLSLIVSLFSWNKLQNNKFNLSLKDWLEQRIKLLSKWLLSKYRKLYIVLIPVLLVMLNLSIHVYYEYKPFIEVIRNEESIYGLILGFIFGLIVSWYAIHKIHMNQLKNLEFLKELHGSLSGELPPKQNNQE